MAISVVTTCATGTVYMMLVVTERCACLDFNSLTVLRLIVVKDCLGGVLASLLQCARYLREGECSLVARPSTENYFTNKKRGKICNSISYALPLIP